MRILPAMLLMFTLNGCSGGGIGSLNPFKWFGGNDQTVARSIAPRRGYSEVVDRRILIDQVTELRIEKTPYGSIVRATGLAPTRGYHAAELVQVNSTVSGQLRFEFRVRPPTTVTSAGASRDRQIIAATYLPASRLRGLRQITIAAARNSSSTRP